MRNKVFLILRVCCIISIIVSFFLPWIDKGILSVSGINLPKLNETLTKATNLLYVFTPSKKSMPEIGYVLYVVPLLSIVSLLLIRTTFSNYLLLVASLAGLAAGIYLFKTIAGIFSVSGVGTGIYVLLITSGIYISLFFGLRFRKRKKEFEEYSSDSGELPQESKE